MVSYPLRCVRQGKTKQSPLSKSDQTAVIRQAVKHGTPPLGKLELWLRQPQQRRRAIAASSLSTVREARFRYAPLFRGMPRWPTTRYVVPTNEFRSERHVHSSPTHKANKTSLSLSLSSVLPDADRPSAASACRTPNRERPISLFHAFLFLAALLPVAPADVTAYTYLGCYKDNQGGRIMSMVASNRQMTAEV